MEILRNSIITIIICLLCPIKADEIFLIAARGAIKKMTVTAKSVDFIEIFNNTEYSNEIDYDFKSGTIYWNDIQDKKIYSTNIDGTNQRTILDQLGTVEGFAVDWIYGNLYWTDSLRQIIGVSKLNGKFRTALIEDDIDKPRAIALIPNEGLMFWTDWSENPRIERAGMDGSERKIIINEIAGWPNGLVLDSTEMRLYWLDGKSGIISSCDFNGNNLNKILTSDLVRGAFSLTLLNDWLYWTNLGENAVYKFNKSSQDQVHKLTNEPQYAFSIIAYDKSRQTDGVNFCQSSNQRCSDLCLAAPSSSQSKVTCKCETGFNLSDDKSTCVPDLTVDKSTIKKCGEGRITYAQLLKGVEKCQSNNGGCSHLCINSRRDCYCECYNFYKLIDNFKCEKQD